MGLVAGQDGAADGYEPVLIRRDRPELSAAPVAALFRRPSAQASRRGVLHLQTAGDGPVPPDLANWYTERGFHFYVATLAWPGRPRSADSGTESAAADSAADGNPADSSPVASIGGSNAASPAEPAALSRAGGAGAPAAPGPAGAMAARAAMVAKMAAAARPGDAAGQASGPAHTGSARHSPAQGCSAPDGTARDGVDAEPATAVRAMALTALRMAGQQGSDSGAAGPAGSVPRQGRPAGAAESRLSKAGAAAGAHAASVLPSAAGPAVSGLAAGRGDDAPARHSVPGEDRAPGKGRPPGKDSPPDKNSPPGTSDDEPDDNGARAAAGKVRAGRRGRKALEGAFAELDARCAQLRAEDGIDNVIIMAHGAGALPAALWCAAQPPGGQADALILYGPDFAGTIREDLDIECPVLLIGGSGGQQRRGPVLRRRPAPATVPLGRHVTWLHPADGDARPDAEDAADRSRFFDEMGRWLGAYMYGQVRDQLL